MGLFSRFKKRDTRHDELVTFSDSSISDSYPSVGECPANNIERCIYANAKFVGMAVMVYETRSGEGRPNFMHFLQAIIETIPETLFQLKYAGWGPCELYRPSDYDELFTEASKFNWAEYINDCGNVAYYQELQKQGRAIDLTNGILPVNWPTQIDALLASSDMATAQCLSLLKHAGEQGNFRVQDILIGETSYLFGLLGFSLVLQANLFHMRYKNSVMFIPDKLLSGPIQASLKLIEKDVNPDAPVVVLPVALKSIVFIPNEDNSVSLGRQILADSQGVFVKTDQDGCKVLEAVASNFVQGLKLQMLK